MGFEIPLLFVLISLFGVLYVALYESLIGESCEELGNHRWLLWECKPRGLQE